MRASNILYVRFIPAQAGNTSRATPTRPPATVHPRAGGEHARNSQFSTVMDGSSPRRRGTPKVAPRGFDRARFIPAQAGNTGTGCARSASASVHPRAGGEHCRVRGLLHSFSGSSPRRRGTPRRNRRAPQLHRFIPAQAGNTDCSWLVRRSSSVHPRAGGEHARAIVSGVRLAGSSPRRRGTPDVVVPASEFRRFIPAQAGNTPSRHSVRPCGSVHPRAGGDMQRNRQESRHNLLMRREITRRPDTKWASSPPIFPPKGIQ